MYNFAENTNKYNIIETRNHTEYQLQVRQHLERDLTSLILSSQGEISGSADQALSSFFEESLPSPMARLNLATETLCVDSVNHAYRALKLSEILPKQTGNELSRIRSLIWEHLTDLSNMVPTDSANGPMYILGAHIDKAKARN